MISFIASILILIAAYFIYGRLVERIFGPDPLRPTPANTMRDGIDYIPMPAWRVYLIQFLNIAGTGPIFGAIMGAKFGPSSYLWIVLGCIFGGAVHDYMVGMLSLRNKGASLTELVGKYMGESARRLMLVFTMILMLLVGTVFVYSPALILGDLTGDGSRNAIMIWVGIIFVYYMVATVLPIDKLIGRIYPLFAACMLFMALALMACLFIKWPQLPEITDGLANMGNDIGTAGQSIFPCLFITIACGAISGFHGTQSPLMARCLTNEKLGRPIFYGSMITEGIVALIWAAVSSYFFFDGGAAECGSTVKAAAPAVVTSVAKTWLGVAGGILAIIGVVIAPVTSGDTAFRSARLILADFFKINQTKKSRRLAISIPMFMVTALLLWFNVANENGFNLIWRYFGLANQSLAAIALWTTSIYLVRRNRKPVYLITALPAAFMTSVCITYIVVDKSCFAADPVVAPYVAVAAALASAVVFLVWKVSGRNK